MKSNIKLFNHCIPIKGSERSIINDLQRSAYKLIPNSLCDLLVNYDGFSIKSVKKAYENKHNETIDEYISFLIKNEYIFLTNEPELFPKLNLTWKAPSNITNAIVGLNKNVAFNIKSILEDLEKLNCKALQFNVFSKINSKEIDKILDYCINSRIRSIEFILPFSESITLQVWKKIFIKHQRLCKVLIYCAKHDCVEYIDEQKSHAVFYSTTDILKNNLCGNIHPNNFVQNIPFFTESLHYNTCLNRKVCIDENGYIKNCLSLGKHYGNINEVDLKEVVKSEEFQKLWHIKKDNIKICKDCEFRHMCMDCRAFIKDSKDIYSQPSKCHYNPYIAKWKGQEGYITVEEWQNQQGKSRFTKL